MSLTLFYCAIHLQYSLVVPRGRDHTSGTSFGVLVRYPEIRRYPDYERIKSDNVPVSRTLFSYLPNTSFPHVRD